MKKAALYLTLVTALAACGGGGDDINRAGMEVEKLGRVSGPGACGVNDAYRVTSVAGVRLSQSATLGRDTLETLDRCLRREAIPIIGGKGGGLVGIRVPSHYACRTRNSRRGARLSEHAKGRAIDISAFILADGSRITVLNGWRGSDADDRLHSHGLRRRRHRHRARWFGRRLFALCERGEGRLRIAVTCPKK